MPEGQIMRAGRARRVRYIPELEGLEQRVALTVLTPASAAHAHALPPGYLAAIPAHRPVLSPGIDSSQATFIDPTAAIPGGGRVGVSNQVYIGPFATLVAGRNMILVGPASDIQDNVDVDARGGAVTIGSDVAIAHGATIVGPAQIGSNGGQPAFIGFNAVVDGATVQAGAMVLGLARVAPGIVIPSGVKVLPGKFVQIQAEASDPNLGKVDFVTDRDRAFIAGVLSVNKDLARGYSVLAKQSRVFVRGIAPNPFTPAFNQAPTLPVLAGRPTLDPQFRDRIIGAVQLQDPLSTLGIVLGHDDSIRADEGFPFILGHLDRVADRVTLHALVGSGKAIGQNDRFGYHSLVHGGQDVPNPAPGTTVIGDNVTIGAFAVVYASSVGDGAVIGDKSYIEKSTIAPGQIVPPGTILINGVRMGTVEW